MIAMHVSMFTGTVRTHSKLLMTTVVHETKRGMSSSAQLSENAIFVCQVVGVTIEKPFFKYMQAIVNLSFIYRFSGEGGPEGGAEPQREGPESCWVSPSPA